MKCEMSNTSAVFKEYMAASSRENLILRYGDLSEVHYSPKTDKLERLFEHHWLWRGDQDKSGLNTVRNELKRDAKKQELRR